MLINNIEVEQFENIYQGDCLNNLYDFCIEKDGDFFIINIFNKSIQDADEAYVESFSNFSSLESAIEEAYHYKPTLKLTII